jgi:hypothetical protein
VDPDPDPYPDPDSVTLWIRIRIENPDLGSGSGSRGKKIKKFQWENALFSYFFKNFTTQKVYNSIIYFLKKYLMNKTGIFDLI